MCTEPLLHIGHCFVINLPLEARKCVLGLDRCVSDPDIGVGAAPARTRSSPTHCGPQFVMSSSPLSVASSVPSSPSFPKCGWGDLPELLRFGDQPPSPPWDSDAEKCFQRTGLAPASIANTAPLPPFTNNLSNASKSSTETPRYLNPIRGSPRRRGGGPDVHCRATAIPPTTPQVRTQGPPHPPQTHCSRALQCQNIAARPGESRGWGSVFRRRGAEPPSDVPVCGSATQEKPLAGVAGGHAK